MHLDTESIFKYFNRKQDNRLLMESPKRWIWVLALLNILVNDLEVKVHSEISAFAHYTSYSYG